MHLTTHLLAEWDHQHLGIEFLKEMTSVVALNPDDEGVIARILDPGMVESFAIARDLVGGTEAVDTRENLT